MAGHLGAAVVTGYFFGETLADLDQQIYAAIERDLDQIIRGEESLWYDTKKAGISFAELFEPFPDEPPNPELIGRIADQLSANIGTTRQSGHNVIFSSIAIRALHDHPQFAKPSIVGGICQLIEQFDDAGPGRGYYGKQRGWLKGDEVSPPEDDAFPVYQSLQAMAEVVVDELIRSAAVRKQGYGGLFHVINHATALTELSRFGYDELANQGLPAHHYHMRLWRGLPDVEHELGALNRATFDPRTPAYWAADGESQWSARLTHRIKTLYGFFTLLRFVEDEAKRKRAEERFLYLMA
jgi:hypothetical protein